MKKTTMRLFPVLAVVGGVTYAVAKKVETDRSQAPEPREHTLRVQVSETSCGDNDISLAALSAVLQMEAAQAMPLLHKVLDRRDACSAELRQKAVFLVSQQNTPEREEILLRVARDDRDMEVRKQAVFWLSQVPGDEAVAGLESVLMQSNEQELRERAVFALSQHPSDRANAILRAYVQKAGEPDELRENAIFWLGNEGSAEDQAFLKELYSDLGSQQLKEKILFAVSQRSNEDSRNWLIDVARNHSESVEMRKKAVFWLSQQGGFRADDLKGLYRSSPELELREQVLFALSQRHEPDAVTELIDIARNETNSDLREKAMFWLGQSGDPRAAEFLLEVIER
jgi:HEAT repeat protein